MKKNHLILSALFLVSCISVTGCKNTGNSTSQQEYEDYYTIDVSSISKEVLKGSIIDINLIFKKAIGYGASKIVCLHNHPSGDPTPSNQDVLLTKKIIKMGDMLDVKLLDHIIIGKKSYISLKKEMYI